MILVNDMDLVPGFTNRHTAIRAPEMFDHAILSDPEMRSAYAQLRHSCRERKRSPAHSAWLRQKKYSGQRKAPHLRAQRRSQAQYCRLRPALDPGAGRAPKPLQARFLAP